MKPARTRLAVEWPTFAMFVLCYGSWALAVFTLPEVSLAAAVALAALAIALFSSLQHEVVHGHPFANPRANAVLAFPALTLVIPFGRFRDTHLAHHRDSDLTDPYDDPESNYLDPLRWAVLPRWVRSVLLFNNTLIGRIAIGPLVGQIGYLLNEVRAHRSGDHRVLSSWLWHLPSVGLVMAAVAAGPMPLWAYVAAVYLGLGLIKIRTFLEHRAHDAVRARTAIVEDCGPLAWLFLNNNLHVVHHAHPEVPWYRLPALYRSRRERFLAMNDHYVYRGYGAVIRRYLFDRKDPVPHPLMNRPG
ncbi:MAG: fatty acid desaturase [Paracoccaceae bacterium]|nr:fatty acid desaturase [Paracoccaceae bacterium]